MLVTSDSEIKVLLGKLPKAELHLHLEGTLLPHRILSLAQKYSVPVDWNEVHSRYNTRNFTQFLELYKWATSFLREAEDYALLAEDAAAAFHEQGIVYAEITLSAGVMLLRKQNVTANFIALRDVFHRRAQSRVAADLRNEGVVAFGLGGDELSVPLSEFHSAYSYAAEHGLHLLAHAGETGGPEQIKDAIDILHAERIGHGIAALRSTALMNTLAERKIPLEICPSSNLRTNALNIQLNSATSDLSQHPLPKFFRHGIPVTLSTDDPAMFHTTLLDEYSAALQMGLSLDDLLVINRTAFEQSFLSDPARQSFLVQLTPVSPES